MSQKVLLSSKEINIILHRLACQLLENHLTFENTVLIGIQPRGKYVAQRLTKILKENGPVSLWPPGKDFLLEIVFIKLQPKVAAKSPLLLTII